MTNIFSTTVMINADPAAVWTVLTTPERMSVWMGETEMQITVSTDWRIDSPILISGFHHAKFENKGVVLQYVKENRLTYNHLSDISRLPDHPDNYTILDFALVQMNGQTQLTLNIGNFPTEVIRKHLEFYWRTTIIKIKKMVEAATTFPASS